MTSIAYADIYPIIYNRWQRTVNPQEALETHTREQRVREGRGKAHNAPTRTMAEPGLSVDLSEDPRAAPEPPGGAQPHTNIRTHTHRRPQVLFSVFSFDR